MFSINAFLCALVVVGCAAAPTGAGRDAQKGRLPELGPARALEPGVLFHEVSLPGKRSAKKLWVYLPERAGGAKAPCVLIAPAGSKLVHGMRLGEGDRAEHLPYARAGFVVVAYEISGPLTGAESDEQAEAAMEAFRKAEAGVADARAALDYALAKIPQVDPARVYTAGHSSAATLSLLVAQEEPRVSACVAFAPATDLIKFLGPEFIGMVPPDYLAFLKRSSPLNAASRLRRPLFLFHAEDDRVVSIAETERFAEEVRKVNPSVTFVRAERGGHYRPMVEQGIPRAIEWLKKLAG